MSKRLNARDIETKVAAPSKTTKGSSIATFLISTIGSPNSSLARASVTDSSSAMFSGADPSDAASVSVSGIGLSYPTITSSSSPYVRGKSLS